VQTQVAFGPRIPGSQAHAKVIEWMRSELEAAGWQVQIQSSESMGHPIQNLIAYRNDEPPQILLGAHYDSRLWANRDPDPNKQHDPVPGADDGASGVAILLGLAHTLPKNSVPVWLVFFDAEDNGEIPGWDWLLGSKAFVANMTVKPKEMILVDMVGGADLHLPMEGNSTPELSASIWQTAADLGYKNVFIPEVKYDIEDDHVPFLQAGIPSVDIIDIDYPYWHTTSDTPDHVSAQSLQMVGDVLWTWITRQNPQQK
jgi:glutaminyl-peptide cyclotransferase